MLRNMMTACFRVVRILAIFACAWSQCFGYITLSQNMPRVTVDTQTFKAPT